MALDNRAVIYSINITFATTQFVHSIITKKSSLIITNIDIAILKVHTEPYLMTSYTEKI